MANINDSDLSPLEVEMINRGKHHWIGIIPKGVEGDYITNDTLKYVIESIVEDVWVNAANFYKPK